MPRGAFEVPDLFLPHCLPLDSWIGQSPDAAGRLLGRDSCHSSSILVGSPGGGGLKQLQPMEGGLVGVEVVALTAGLGVATQGLS